MSEWTQWAIALLDCATAVPAELQALHVIDSALQGFLEGNDKAKVRVLKYLIDCYSDKPQKAEGEDD